MKMLTVFEDQGIQAHIIPGSQYGLVKTNKQTKNPHHLIASIGCIVKYQTSHSLLAGIEIGVFVLEDNKLYPVRLEHPHS